MGSNMRTEAKDELDMRKDDQIRIILHRFEANYYASSNIQSHLPCGMSITFGYTRGARA